MRSYGTVLLRVSFIHVSSACFPRDARKFSDTIVQQRGDARQVVRPYGTPSRPHKPAHLVSSDSQIFTHYSTAQGRTRGIFIRMRLVLDISCHNNPTGHTHLRYHTNCCQTRWQRSPSRRSIVLRDNSKQSPAALPQPNGAASVSLESARTPEPRPGPRCSDPSPGAAARAARRSCPPG